MSKAERQRLNTELRERVFALAAAGTSHAEIARLTGRTPRGIACMLRNRHHHIDRSV